MEGLSGFDRSMTKRLESSALAIYELKHHRHQHRQQIQSSADETAGRTSKTVGVRQRHASDTPLSSSLSSGSRVCGRAFSGETVGAVLRETDDDARLTATARSGNASPPGDASPRPTADGPAASSSSSSNSDGSISFSISRILGHAGASPAAPRPRPPGSPAGLRPSTAERGLRGGGGGVGGRRSQSPDSSCRVAGDDDVIDDDDVTDDDVVVNSLRSPPPPPITAAAASVVSCAGSLQRLTWLQCTRYKPPKLPSTNLRLYIFML